MTPNESDIEFDSILAQAILIYNDDNSNNFNKKIRSGIDPTWQETYKKRYKLRPVLFFNEEQTTKGSITRYGRKIYMPSNNYYISSKKELAERLKYIRRCSGVCQQEVANYLGIERSTYAYYEVAKTTPCIFILIKLCCFYKVDIGYFVKENYEEVL